MPFCGPPVNVFASCSFLLTEEGPRFVSVKITAPDNAYEAN